MYLCLIYLIRLISKGVSCEYVFSLLDELMQGRRQPLYYVEAQWEARSAEKGENVVGASPLPLVGIRGLPRKKLKWCIGNGVCWGVLKRNSYSCNTGESTDFLHIDIGFGASA